MENVQQEDTYQQQTYKNNIILICGLPGAGKSSLVRNAINTCPSHSNTKILVYVIEYDALYLNRTCAATFDTEEWKRSREDATKIVEHLLQNKNSVNSSNVQPAWISDSLNPLNTSKYIIIDDNLFYRSMRRTYYNLAREYNCGFAQIHVSCPISECLIRNKGRENQVPESIIHEMQEKFEHPDTTHTWESHTIQISSHPNFSAFPWNEVMCCCAEPIQPIDESEKDASRATNLINLAHQFDLQARKSVSALMKDLTSLNPPMDPNQVRALGKVLSIAKQQHVNNIHKLENTYADPKVLAALLQDFQADMQRHVLAINTPK